MFKYIIIIALASCGDLRESAPRTLIIGDSISQGYGQFVPNAFHAKGNNRHSGYALENGNLERWIAQVPDADLITFNHGQHDMYRMDPEATLPVRTTLEEYRDNLHLIVDKLEATGIPFIFFTTTGFEEGTLHRLPEDVAPYNAVAIEVMNERGVPVYDLNAWAAAAPSGYQLPSNTHWTDEGYAYLAEFVTNAINQTLTQ